MKRCTLCGEEKPLDAFPRDRSARDGRRPYCKACHNDRERTRRAANPEAYQAAQRRFRENHRDQLRENAQRYREENPDKLRDAARQYREARRDELLVRRRAWRATNRDSVQRSNRRQRETNADKLREATHRWRKNNPDKLKKDPAKAREQARRWRKNHPDRLRETWRTYQARKRGATGRFTVNQWRAMCDWFGGVCLCCGEAKPLTADHVVPIVQGGTNYIDNIQPLCRECNSSKQARHATDYRDPDRLAAFLASLP